MGPQMCFRGVVSVSESLEGGTFRTDTRRETSGVVRPRSVSVRHRL